MDDLDIEMTAIKNALQHDGKADEKAVFSKIVGTDRSLLKDVEGTKKRVSAIVKYVNLLGEDLRKRADELGVSDDTHKEKAAPKNELKELPYVNGTVVLRLPPEPSGYMHLGHAISGMINFLYKQKYNGKLWLRFEDTNPRLVKKEFVKVFEDGYKWLGINWDEKKFITSDLDKIYGYGDKLFRDDKAYVCTCSAEDIKKERLAGVECQCRNRNLNENLSMFNDAQSGKIREKGALVRFKGDMKSKDFALRDSTLFRIIDADYDFPWLERKEKVFLWPIYDFANVIEDKLCGVTHILRSNEFKSSFQDKLREVLGFDKINVVQFSRFNFKGTPFSKRKIRALIKEGKIKDWQDLRLPTLFNMQRRGIRPEAIKDFVLRVGYSESSHEYNWDLLLTLNRRLIDDSAKRMFFVSEPARLEIEDAENIEANIKNHPSANMGYRTIKTDGHFLIDRRDFENINAGDRVRLKDLYSVRMDAKSDDTLFGIFESIKMIGDERIIHWVTDKNVDATVTMIGTLLKEDDTFNEESIKVINGKAEHSIELLQKGDIIQFERFGFCILDDKEKKSFLFISR